MLVGGGKLGHAPYAVAKFFMLRDFIFDEAIMPKLMRVPGFGAS